MSILCQNTSALFQVALLVSLGNKIGGSKESLILERETKPL